MSQRWNSRRFVVHPDLMELLGVVCERIHRAIAGIGFGHFDSRSIPSLKFAEYSRVGQSHAFDVTDRCHSTAWPVKAGNRGRFCHL